MYTEGWYERTVESRGDKFGARGDFPAGLLLSAVSDNRLSAQTLLSTQHIYTLATAEEKGHEGLFVHGAMAIL